MAAACPIKSLAAVWSLGSSEASNAVAWSSIAWATRVSLKTFDGADGRVIVLQEESNSGAAAPSVETTCVLVVADGDRLVRVAKFVSAEAVTPKVP